MKRIFFWSVLFTVFLDCRSTKLLLLFSSNLTAMFYICNTFLYFFFNLPPNLIDYRSYIQLLFFMKSTIEYVYSALLIALTDVIPIFCEMFCKCDNSWMIAGPNGFLWMHKGTYLLISFGRSIFSCFRIKCFEKIRLIFSLNLHFAVIYCLLVT